MGALRPSYFFPLAFVSSSGDDDSMQSLHRLWRRKPLVLIGFTAAVTLSALFGYRAFAHYSDLQDRIGKPVAGWMTPGFIARHYDLDLDDVFEALGIEENTPKHQPLSRMARNTGVPRTELIARVEAAIDREHPERR